VRYAARVAVDPAQPTFHAAIDIDLTLARTTSLLWLNATELTIDKASFTVGGATVPARAVPGNDDFVGFAVDKPLPAGAARLHVEYRGKLSRRDDRGLFAEREGDRWYAITQFESIFARRVFPCFDEPSFKVPWQVTLDVPEKLVALSNTPIASEKPARAGVKTVSFAPTPPLPSYLVAFAVGPYDLVAAGKAGGKQAPVRIAAPFARGKDAGYAASVSAKVIDLLEHYFGSPYPFAKLDVVAIPLTTSFGAMENPGMVTFAQGIVVAQPSNAGISFERTYAVVAAHEFAHQWFGDLVTMKWWNDIWLNESFASWMEAKIIDAWHPEWTRGTSYVDARGYALQADALTTARQIRQPIESNDDIYNAFDGITYQKGESVLAMFERFVGADRFQRGIRSYLAKHANGNAGADDFIAAISQAAGRDLAPAWRSFLDQPGAPMVDVTLACTPKQPPTLTLAQQRFLPVGSKGSTQQRWQIPVCVRWSAGGKTDRTCALMTQPKQTLALGSAAGCPSFVLANDQEVGYYRAAYPTELLQKLLGPDGRKQLSLPELVGVLDDVDALTRAGRVPLGDALAMTPSLADDSRRQVAEEVIGFGEGIHTWLVPKALAPDYVRYVQKVWGPRARALGWTAKSTDDEDTRLLRPTLVAFVADEGKDKQLRAEATALALAWLHDHKAIDADATATVLHVAARAGNRALFDKFHAAARHATERKDRLMLLHALGAFPDAKLAKRALAIVSSKEFDPRESVGILRALGNQPETRQLAWDYLKANFDRLAARLPPETMARSPYFAHFCDEQHERDVEQFFRDRSPKLPGGPRVLAQQLERIGLCRAYVQAQQPSVTAFLKKW
jgi:alanyl aminopeptidase